MDHIGFAELQDNNNNNNNDGMFDEGVSVKAQNRRNRKQQKKEKQGASHHSKPFEALTESQAELMECLDDSEVTQIFAVGPAGTGKTYVPTRYAVRDMLRGMNGNGPYRKLYVARPTISKKEHQLGFLPGTMQKKLEPWLKPIIRAIKDEVSSAQLSKWMQEGVVEFLSFEHMRGNTFDDGYIILDEAQNCTLSDLKLFLTRKGQNSRYMIAGDPDQADIPNSGLKAVVDMIDDQDLTPELVEFSEEDVVRSADAKEWVKAFKRMENVF